MEPSKRLSVAIAIIESSGKILICQRLKDGSFPDVWEFPGGKIEPSETPDACLIRECREELDIEIRPLEPFTPFDHTYPDLVVRLYPYLCQHLTGTPRPLASQRLQWVSLADLGKYPFPAANDILIPRILTRLHGNAAR